MLSATELDRDYYYETLTWHGSLQISHDAGSLNSTTLAAVSQPQQQLLHFLHAIPDIIHDTTFRIRLLMGHQNIRLGES